MSSSTPAEETGGLPPPLSAPGLEMPAHSSGFCEPSSVGVIGAGAWGTALVRGLTTHCSHIVATIEFPRTSVEAPTSSPRTRGAGWPTSCSLTAGHPLRKNGPPGTTVVAESAGESQGRDEVHDVSLYDCVCV